MSFLVSIRLNQEEEHTDCVLKYLSKNNNNLVLNSVKDLKKNNNLIIDKQCKYLSDDDSSDDDSSDDVNCTDDKSDSDTENDTNDIKNNVNYKLELFVDYGEYDITFKDCNLKITYSCDSQVMALMDSLTRLETVIISCNMYPDIYKNKKIIENFILHTLSLNCPKKKDKIHCYISEDGCWKFLSNVPKRTPLSIFHPEKNKIIEDLHKFNKSEKDYIKHGIPYKRNYLFYGEPGTGKTSMLTMIASIFNSELRMVNFSGKINDSTFMRLVSKIPPGSIMVLEDIDALFTERVANDSGTRGSVSFSSILNCLDGIARKNKIITIMTTNYIDRLDKALIRPGRIDLIVNFTLASKNQIKEIFESYFGKEHNDILTKITGEMRDQKKSMASFQKFFFEYRHDVHSLISNINMLKTLDDQYSKSYESLYN